MREKIRALYYPDFYPDPIALIKAILLFDEIHFMDRPAFSFYLNPDPKAGGWGLLGAASPLRANEVELRENGVPLYVHPAPFGPLEGELLESVKADIKDKQFLREFQAGIRDSDRFLELHVPNGKFKGGETQISIRRKLSSIDLERYADPFALYLEPKLKHFDYTTEENVVKELVMHAMSCSTKMNFALSVNNKHGFSPFADASPFNRLLSTKYERALSAVTKQTKTHIPVTELSLAILDELVPSERLCKMTYADVIKYRRESERAREAFMEHLAVLRNKLAATSANESFETAIRKLIDSDIRPAATKFKQEMTTIYEGLFGSLAKRSLIGIAGAAAAASTHLFGDLSWQRLCAMSAGAGAVLGPAAIDAYLEARKAHRECAFSYLLDISKRS
jgi:hypothetical protein